MPKYNKEQQAAIDLRGKTILVSAPAGSGKTRILVARLISLIVNDHYSMDQFLVLTFTKAAGNEMKQIIQGRKKFVAEITDENIKGRLPCLRTGIMKKITNAAR